MVLPLLIAGLGLGIQAFGSIKAAGDAEDSAKLQADRNSVNAKATTKINKLLSQQAKNTAKKASDLARLTENDVAKRNRTRDQIVADINDIRDETLQVSLEQTAIGQEAEDARALAMELDAARRSRIITRDAQRASAVAVSNATFKGAQGGSGLAGGRAGISAEGTRQRTDIFQNLLVGRTLFDASERFAAAGDQINILKAEAETTEALGAARLATLSGEQEVRLAKSAAKFSDKNATLQASIFKAQTGQDQAVNQLTSQIGFKESDKFASQSITNIGSSVTGFSSLFT